MAEGDFAGSEQEASERKFQAKRANEQLKLFASLMNTLAAAVIATAVIVPTIRAELTPTALYLPGWVLIGFFLHVLGQSALRFGMRRED